MPRPGRPTARPSRVAPSSRGPARRARRLHAALLVVALATPGAARAQRYTLDFDALAGAPDRSAIPAGFGSVAGVVDVEYRTRSSYGSTGTNDCPTHGGTTMLFRGSGVGGLRNVAVACEDSFVGEIAFLPAPGRTVTLGSLRFGSAPDDGMGGGPNRLFTFNVYDGAWTLLLSQIHAVDRPITLTPNLTSERGLILQFGVDWEVAVDDIQFTVGPTQVVPEPGTWALVAGGIGALGLVARRRRAPAASDA